MCRYQLVLYIIRRGAAISPSLRLIFRERLVGIAIEPTLVRLGGCDDGMSARVRMFGGMTIGGVIATQCCAAGLAGAQMKP